MTLQARRTARMENDGQEPEDGPAASEESRREATRLLVLEMLIKSLM